MEDDFYAPDICFKSKTRNGAFTSSLIALLSYMHGRLYKHLDEGDGEITLKSTAAPHPDCVEPLKRIAIMILSQTLPNTEAMSRSIIDLTSDVEHFFQAVPRSNPAFAKLLAADCNPNDMLDHLAPIFHIALSGIVEDVLGIPLQQLAPLLTNMYPQWMLPDTQRLQYVCEVKRPHSSPCVTIRLSVAQDEVLLRLLGLYMRGMTVQNGTKTKVSLDSPHIVSALLPIFSTLPDSALPPSSSIRIDATGHRSLVDVPSYRHATLKYISPQCCMLGLERIRGAHRVRLPAQQFTLSGNRWILRALILRTTTPCFMDRWIAGEGLGDDEGANGIVRMRGRDSHQEQQHQQQQSSKQEHYVAIVLTYEQRWIKVDDMCEWPVDVTDVMTLVLDPSSSTKPIHGSQEAALVERIERAVDTVIIDGNVD